MLIRPDLFASAEHQARIRGMVGKGLLDIMSAKADDSLGSFPDPVKDHRGTGFDLLETKSLDRGVVTLFGRGSDGYLIDLDRSSGLFGPRDKIDIGKRVSDGKFDAEFAYFQRNGIAWTYYDVDAKKGYDIVLVALQLTGKASAAYRIEGDQAKYDESLVAGKMVRPGLFKSPLLSKKMSEVAAEVFAPNLIDTN
jgi:hypothetical protein